MKVKELFENEITYLKAINAKKRQIKTIETGIKEKRYINLTALRQKDKIKELEKEIDMIQKTINKLKVGGK
jgi:hypothetical protein